MGQGSFVSEKNLLAAERMLSTYIEEARNKEKLPMVFFLLTNIKEQSSVCLCSGFDSEALLTKAFGCEDKGGRNILPGVISRKKQFIPKMLSALEGAD